MSFFDSFKKVFTRPGKANFREWLTVGGSVAAVAVGGAALAGAGAGAGAGGAAAGAGAGAGAGATAGGTTAALLGPGAGVIAAPSFAAGLVAPIGTNAALAAATGAGGASIGSSAALAGLLGPGAGVLAPTASAASSGGLWATLTGWGKAGAGFITKTAAVSAATKEIISPWQRAVAGVREFFSSPGGAPGGSTIFAPGLTGPAPVSAPVDVAEASSVNWLMVGLAVTVAVGLLVAVLRRKE